VKSENIMTGNGVGACCTHLSTKGHTSVPCIEKISASECLTKKDGVYVGDDATCDDTTVEICKNLPGSCCRDGKCATSPYSECTPDLFAGFGSTCAMCPKVPKTEIHSGDDVSWDANEKNLHVIVRGHVRDRLHPQTRMKSASVSLVSNRGEKLATTEIDEFGQYKIRVNQKYLRSSITAANAPFKVTLNSQKLENEKGQSCVLYRKKFPSHITFQEVTEAVRDLYVVCSSDNEYKQHANEIHDDDDDHHHHHDDTVSQDDDDDSQSHDHDDDDDHHHNNHHNSSDWWIGGLFLFLLFGFCICLGVLWCCYYMTYSEPDKKPKKEEKKTDDSKLAFSTYSKNMFDNVALSETFQNKSKKK
jgi:hypothetical protein